MKSSLASETIFGREQESEHEIETRSSNASWQRNRNSGICRTCSVTMLNLIESKYTHAIKVKISTLPKSVSNHHLVVFPFSLRWFSIILLFHFLCVCVSHPLRTKKRENEKMVNALARVLAEQVMPRVWNSVALYERLGVSIKHHQLHPIYSEFNFNC